MGLAYNIFQAKRLGDDYIYSFWSQSGSGLGIGG